MSRLHRPGHHGARTATESQPDDEAVGEFSRERLIAMDARFRAAMEKAIARGFERLAGGDPAPLNRHGRLSTGSVE
jgi:hypothetical protein